MQRVETQCLPIGVANEDVPFSGVSLKYGTQVLGEGVEGVRRRYLRGSAGAVSRQIRGDDFVTQPRKEIQLTPPDVQRAAHAMDEEECHVRMRPLTAADAALRIDQHGALGSPPPVSGRRSRFLLV